MGTVKAVLEHNQSTPVAPSKVPWGVIQDSEGSVCQTEPQGTLTTPHPNGFYYTILLTERGKCQLGDRAFGKVGPTTKAPKPCPWGMARSGAGCEGREGHPVLWNGDCAGNNPHQPVYHPPDSHLTPKPAAPIVMALQPGKFDHLEMVRSEPFRNSSTNKLEENGTLPHCAKLRQESKHEQP